MFKPSKPNFDFADGESVATIDFTYPDINDFGGEIFQIVLTVADPDMVSPAGHDQLTIKAQRKLTRKFLGTGTFYSGFYEEEAPNYYILPDCWESGVDWTFTVVDGVIVWPDTFDTGYLLDAAVGNVWIKSGDSFVEDGTLYLIVDSYYLPDYYNYDLDSAYESFTLPEGVTL